MKIAKCDSVHLYIHISRGSEFRYGLTLQDGILNEDKIHILQTKHIRVKLFKLVFIGNYEFHIHFDQAT
jgi:hypothetical protein